MSFSSGTPPQIARPRSNPSVPVDDFVRYLISRSPQTPCEAIARVYQEIVPNERRFQIALDVLLPFLSSGPDSSSRITAAYVLYSLYLPHPINMNPFHSALLEAFNISQCQSPQPEDSAQLTWVLWKILNNQGQELDANNPQALAAKELTLDLSTLLIDSNSVGNGAPTVSQEPQTSATSADSNEELARAVNLMLNAGSRVLTLAEQRTLKSHLPSMVLPLPLLEAHDLPGLVTHNPGIAHQLIALLIASHPDQRSEYMAVLGSLPPALPSFDVMGRLLKESRQMQVEGGHQFAVGAVVRSEVLNQFLHSCVEWIDKREAQSQDQEDATLDDSLEKATEHLCRFYKSLINAGLIDTTSDIETIEMTSFALQHSRLEEANALYRILALART